MNNRRERFEEIFARHEWGGDSRSGPGSDPRSTRPYVEFLNGWLRQHTEARKIVEVGCGDWATSRLVDFSGKQYLGLDIVDSLIEKNRAQYGSPTLEFARADFVDDEIPLGDVLIAKDALQHLSDQSVLKFLAKAQQKFKYLILTNDISKIKYNRVFGLPFKQSLQNVNQDISDGESRPLRLDLPPFNLVPSKRLRYDTVICRKPKIVYTKEIAVCATVR